MAYNIQALKSDLDGVLHGTTTNQVTGINQLIYRAARQLLLDVDPQETKRISPISGTVYNGVWDYPVAADLKGNRVIDIFPQANRYPTDLWQQAYNQDFDRTKGLPWSSEMFSILINSGLKSVRINAPFLPVPILIDSCSSTTGWVASGGATTPVIDNVNFVDGGGSLQFNLSAGQASGTITKTLSSPIDLSNHLNQSTLFLNTYLPTPSAVTSVVLKWGTDASNYYTNTITTTQQNTTFAQGWNLLNTIWSGATTVGSPNASSISYVAVTWNYNSTLQTAVRLDNINSNLGSILNMEYYSKYLFRNASTGVFQENVTDDTNLINLDVESYNLLFNLCAHLCAQQTQGIDASFYDGTFFLQKYTEGVARYKAIYKSEIQSPVTRYYNQTRNNPRMWGGRWW